MSNEVNPYEDPPQQQKSKMTQTKHGFVERFFRVTPTRNTAFITKLFSMVEDESIRNLICWSGQGDQFTVFNKNDFSRIVLPRYFKHGNWASFVRQLNMYDFRKVNETSSKGKDSNTEHWDFKHPAFTKANFNKLHKIRRKLPKNRLVPQARYSDSSPSHSPDYEGETSSFNQNNTSESSNGASQLQLEPPHYRQQLSGTMPNSSASSTNQFHIEETPHYQPALNDALHQLKVKADVLESKIDATNYEVHYLRNVIDNQRVLLTEILDSVQYLRPNKEATPHAETMESNNKPTKINDLLTENPNYSNINFLHYDGNSSSTIGQPPMKKRKKGQSKK